MHQHTKMSQLATSRILALKYSWLDIYAVFVRCVTMTWIEQSLLKCPVIYITDSVDLQSRNWESKASGKHQIISNPPGGWRNKFHPNQCSTHFLSTLHVKLWSPSETQKKKLMCKTKVYVRWPKAATRDVLCKKVFWKRLRPATILKKRF